jgi:hypothetical protein
VSSSDLCYGRFSRGPVPATPHLTPELGHQSSRDGGSVEDHLLRRVADFADAERATWVQAAACRMVAALFDAGNVVACRVPVGRLSDLEFAEALVCCELELIAAGDDPVRISLQMAVMRTARDALRLCAAIDALPEALSRQAWTQPTPSGLP